MGTRADFYVRHPGDGKGPADPGVWLGSIAFDGDPGGEPEALGAVRGEASYRRAVSKILQGDDATVPAQGWPWPWPDSTTTDFAYTWHQGVVWVSCFGSPWVSWDVATRPPTDAMDWDDDQFRRHLLDEGWPVRRPSFPDMSPVARPARAGTRRSGIMSLRLS